MGHPPFIDSTQPGHARRLDAPDQPVTIEPDSVRHHHGLRPGSVLHLAVPALATEITAVRRAVAAWATGLGLDPDTVDDLALATYEALANAVDHAYPTGPGTVRVTATSTEDEVIIVVGDQGRWRPPPAPGERGRGLVLISHLTHHLELRHDTGGTTVTMTWHHPDLPSRRTSEAPVIETPRRKDGV
ncbi:MAG: ATP-binding protein [Pseudonocardiaceae bacterium]